MNAEMYLTQVRKLDQLIDAKIAEREQLYVLATSASAKPLDGMPFSNTGVVSRTVENVVVDLIALAEEINALIDRYVDIKDEIAKLLEKLPEKEYGVLHRYYIRYMTLEQIAEDMGYSVRQINRIKRNGLKTLQDVIECHHTNVV